ncbi:MAG: hypothetical protein HY247_01305 [archaeon]|nr:MAG: hypothetical protein HY247_01305 [archaeon]
MMKVRVVEGKTRLVVPARSLEGAPPSQSPVFFNPAAKLNRDVSVSIAAAARSRTFCDSLAGVGSRGLRVAVESGKAESVALVDFNKEALKLAREGARLNRVAGVCQVVHGESNSFLFGRFGRLQKFDSVDVDPFGSPIGHVQAAVSATAKGGIASFTATDTAALCGVYPSACRRRYGAEPLNNSFHHETGIRILLGGVASLAASLEIGVAPVAVHSSRHYIRAYVRVEPGASKADAAIAHLGYLVSGMGCRHMQVSDKRSEACATCGGKARSAGPLWKGGLADGALTRSAEEAAKTRGLLDAESLLGRLEAADDFPPWSFSIEEACSSLGVATVPRGSVLRHLAEAGHTWGEQPFEKTGVKTNASYDEFYSAVKESTVRLGR